MTDTETVEPEAVEAEDNTPDVLRTWGLSGQPSTWAQYTWVPLVETIRAANHGEVDAAAVQGVLDATFPDAGYQAADIVLAHPPSAAFVVGDGDIDPDVDPDVDSYIRIIRVDLADDEDLGLPNEQVMWDFGDGTASVSDAYGYEHGYREPGTYTVRCTVPVGGVAYTTSQDVEVGDVTAVEPTVDPAYAAREATVFTDPDELEEQIAANQAAQAAATPEEEAPPDEEEPDEEFDPADHTVEEVLAYVADNPDEVDDIVAAEEDGKARVTLLDKLAPGWSG